MEPAAMQTTPFPAEQIVAEVIQRWPATARVFLEHRMACVGCTMAPFMTLADAAEAYGLGLDDFLVALEKAVSAPERRS